MAPSQNLLDVLRERTVVDCDTMDVEGVRCHEITLIYYTNRPSCSERW
jgi:hypothetical protein